MIDEKQTFERFGYVSTDLSSQSGKKIVSVCDNCGKIRELMKFAYHELCVKCAAIKRSKSPGWQENVAEAARKRSDSKSHREKMKMFYRSDEWLESVVVANRKAHLGRKKTDEQKRHMRESRIGKTHTAISKEKNKQHMLKIRQNRRWNNQIDNFINGDLVIDWIERPTRHYEISEEDYDKWRHGVYKRDNHTCQICGATHCCVHAHHIIPQRINHDLIIDINNGITMCPTCHGITYNREEMFAGELQMMVSGTN